MTCSMAHAPEGPADGQDSEFLPAPLALLLATARQEIDAHTDDHALCASCGNPYPCERHPGRTGPRRAVAMMASISGTACPSRLPAGTGRARRGRAGAGTVDRAAAPAATSSPRQSIAPVPVPPSSWSQGQPMPGHWPLRSFLELGALPGAVPCARLHTRQLAWEWGLAGLSNDAATIVTELLTNAVAAARAVRPVWPVRLWLLSDATQIVIAVWDANPQPPARTQAGEDAESGRGMLLVEAFSLRWGWYPAQDTIGKVVWALIRAELQGS
jgi:anti-sigma regulatory factor (Ser/Thr protein kinase)